MTNAKNNFRCWNDRFDAARGQFNRVRFRLPPQDSSPWSVDFGLGIDNSISGTVNSSAIGRLNNQSVVILKNSYEDV